MCIVSWAVYIGSSGQIVAQIVITLYRDRKSRETKTASYLNRAHLIVMNVLYRIQMYSARIRSCQIGNPDRDNPALDRDHHIRTYVILSERAILS